MGFWDEEAFEDAGGGGISTFTGVITEAYFSENDYGASLRIVSLFDHPELYPEKEAGTYTQFYSLGQQATEWKTEGGGESVAHQADPNKKARKDSDFGRLGEAFRELPGLREERPDFNPYTAASYKGLHLEWRRGTYEVKRYQRDAAGNRIAGPDGKDLLEPFTKYIMLPVALIGSDAAPVAVDLVGLNLTSEQIAALGAAKTDTEFMQALMELGLTGNQDVMKLVSSNLAGFRAALPF